MKPYIGLELITELDLIPKNRVLDLMKEVNEIIAMVVASLKTLRNSKS